MNRSGKTLPTMFFIHLFSFIYRIAFIFILFNILKTFKYTEIIDPVNGNTHFHNVVNCKVFNLKFK